MGTTDNADMVLRVSQGEIERAQATLARDAQYFADDAARFAAGIASGTGTWAGEANRLAQTAVQLAVSAARLVGQTESAAYLNAVVEGIRSVS